MRIITSTVAMICVVTSAPVPAQESERLRQLEQDIHALKETVVEQGRRIETLEIELRGKSPAAASNVAAGTRSSQPASPTGQPWHDRNSWGRVRKGMSEAQVVSILGRPTSFQTVGGFKTLFYRGEVSDSGSVSGNIKLQDDRVWQVNTPVF